MARLGLTGTVLIAVAVLMSDIPSAEAHRSGCHRWHSCPSDSGSYTCGDLGYCSACADNKYCSVGKPRRQESNQLLAPWPERGAKPPSPQDQK
jgi:hypothetical protein